MQVEGLVSMVNGVEELVAKAEKHCSILQACLSLENAASCVCNPTYDQLKPLSWVADLLGAAGGVPQGEIQNVPTC